MVLGRQPALAVEPKLNTFETPQKPLNQWSVDEKKGAVNYVRAQCNNGNNVALKQKAVSDLGITMGDFENMEVLVDCLVQLAPSSAPKQIATLLSSENERTDLNGDGHTDVIRIDPTSNDNTSSSSHSETNGKPQDPNKLFNKFLQGNEVSSLTVDLLADPIKSGMANKRIIKLRALRMYYLYRQAGFEKEFFRDVVPYRLIESWENALGTQDKPLSTVSQLQKIKIKHAELARDESHNFVTAGDMGMEGVARKIQVFGKRKLNGLILGETGTGKNQVAEELHSIRTEGDRGNFISVQIGAGSDELIASTLFGHTRGAYTGAIADRLGAFGALSKSGGTLLIDEIGEMPLTMQVQLLTVLDSGMFYPVGSDEPQKIGKNCHVIAATNADLEAKVKNGTFRADLYSRLKGYIIEVPNLESRTDTHKTHLVTELLTRLSKDENVEIDLNGDALETLLDAKFPQNVRDLRDTINRAFSYALFEKPESHHVTITNTHVLEALGEQSVDDGESLDTMEGVQSRLNGKKLTIEIDVEKNRGRINKVLGLIGINSMLEYNDNNRTHAADYLGFSVRTLQRKLRALEAGEDIEIHFEEEDNSAGEH